MGRLVFVFLVGAMSVFGADRYFVGTGTADFNTVGNWDAGGVPGVDDVVFFNTAFSNLLFSADAGNTAAVFSGTRTNALNTGAYAWRLNEKAVIAQGEATAVRFNGGKYVFGGLVATNADETGNGSGRFDFANGELTTFGDVHLWAPTNGFAANMSPVIIGSAYNNSDVFVWNVTNGTVYIRTFGLLNTADGRNNNLWIGNMNAKSKTVLNLKGPGTVLTNNNWAHVGRNGGVDKRDCVLNISEGAKMYNAGALFVGWRGTGNRVFVSGTNSLLVTGQGLTVAKNSAGGTGNRVYITTGGVLRCTSVGIQEGDQPADYESGGKIVVAGPGARLEASALISVGGSGLRGDFQVLDGAEVLTGNTLKVGNGVNGSLHRVIIDGPGSRYTATGGNVYFEGSTNTVTVRNGGTLEFTSAKPNVASDGYELTVSDPGSSLRSVGLAASGNVRIAITNGAQALVSSGIDMGFTKGKTTRFLLDGAGTIVSNTLSAITPFLRLGCMEGALVDISIGNEARFIWAETNSTWGTVLGHSNTGMARMVVSDSGRFEYTGRNAGLDGTLTVGLSGRGELIVRDGGTVVWNGQGMNIGTVDSAAGSFVEVASGGLLDMTLAGFRVYGYPGNAVRLDGGILQFTKSNPAIAVDAGSDGVGFTNSVLAFRNCSGVNILDNKTGRFNVFAWGGDNTFRLNGATNNTQNYTFGKTADPTDYVNLELFNGAKFNGNVTVNEGRLGLAGTNAITGNLTLNTGASLALSDTTPLAVSGTLSAATDTVSATLSAAPQMNVPQTLITAGSIAAFPMQKFVQTFDGKSYEITLSAAGNRIVAGYYTGTVIKLY